MKRSSGKHSGVMIWRVRQQPSVTDRELISRLRDEHVHSGEGFEISPTKLERWRSHGLLPRVTVERSGFGGTKVAPHSDEVVNAARLLGRTSRQGRPWQRNAEMLFNAGYPLRDNALQATATFLMRTEVSSMKRAWAEARKDASPTDSLSETAAEVGERAAQRLPRFLKSAVRNEIALAHGCSTSDAQIKEYADRALTWRMVDFAMPAHERAQLGEKARNLARHGVEEHMLGLAGVGLLPLPSERNLVARTLTWEEAKVYRHFAVLRTQENPALQQLGFFTIMTWIVASERLNVPPHDLEVAVSERHLALAQALLVPPSHAGSARADPHPRRVSAHDNDQLLPGGELRRKLRDL